MSVAARARLPMFESLVVSPEALRRLSEIGEGSDWSYDSLTSVEEAQGIIDSIKGRARGAEVCGDDGGDAFSESL